MKIGVLSLQGGVAEHLLATKKAAAALDVQCGISEAKRCGEFSSLDGLIIPGGESTTFGKLITTAGLWDELRSVPNIFGTCAGAILLAKKVIGQEQGGQDSIGLMDIEADRNAYGSQLDSFEEELDTKLGKVNAVFIRAPKLQVLRDCMSCEVLARRNNTDETVAISESLPNNFYLATSFHPELSTTLFHELFLRKIRK